MALEIEDGTGKQNSQSYVGATEAREFALLRGVVLPAAPGGGDPDPVEAMLMQAMDYLESLEPRFRGTRTNAHASDPSPYFQALSWPRSDARLGNSCDTLANDQIPANLAAAQCQLVIAASRGIVLQPIYDPSTKLVKRKKVDVLETEYFSPKEGGTEFGTSPMFPVVDALLQPLMTSGGWGNAMAYRG